MKRFYRKVAIITGSSSGIGAATAILFAKEGAKVTITGRKQHGLEATKKAILEAGAHSEDVNVVQADVTDAHGREQIISSTIQKFGRLDILVNNAGGTFLSPDGSAGLKASTDLLKKTMDVNVYSVVELIQLARPYLISSKGEIVNVSSIAGLPTAYAKIPYYAMSKSALDQMMRAVAIELIAEGVRVNNVSPGGVMTNIAQNSGVSDEVAAKFYASYARNPFEVPSGRIADPSEIATVIAFLADRSQSSYIVGQTIVADDDKCLSLFLIHGGLASANEVAYSGTPAVVVPLSGDQMRNAQMLARHQRALIPHKSYLTNSKILKQTFDEVLNTPSFARNAERLALVLRKPISPKELLLKHVEFAAKFGRLSNLDPYGRQLSFFQYYLIDILAVVTTTIPIMIAVVCLVRRYCCRRVPKLKQS